MNTTAITEAILQNTPAEHAIVTEKLWAGLIDELSVEVWAEIGGGTWRQTYTVEGSPRAVGELIKQINDDIDDLRKQAAEANDAYNREQHLELLQKQVATLETIISHCKENNDLDEVSSEMIHLYEKCYYKD